jgi:phytanoyl-CoA dioxygenase PhyH
LLRRPAADWRDRTAAFLRGDVTVRRLEPVEVAALPDLLNARSLGSVLWRAARMPPDSYSLEVAAGACHAGGMLSEAEIGSFVADGFVAIRDAVPAGVLRACQEEIWSALAERGVLRDAPATWRDPVVRIPCPESEAFAAAGTQPSLWEAFDQLIGAERWWRRPGVGGTIPVRFPSQADPGDAGWHIEASYETNGQWCVNHRSRARGLLVLYLFSDVDADSAPTRVRPGSHRDAARALVPAGDAGMRWTEAAQLAAQASAARPTSLVTGRAGDVFLCHPFLVHAASWPHNGRHPRIIAQPGVALHGSFPLVMPLSPVELPMAADPAPGDPGTSRICGNDRRSE